MRLHTVEPINNADHSASVSIATWFLTTTFVIMFLSGQTIKYVVLRRFSLDDYLLLAAALFAIAMSVTFSIAASHGLGSTGLSQAQFDNVQKSLYAGFLLYIASITFSQLSLIAFVYQINVKLRRPYFVLALAALTASSTFGELVAAALQCGLPKVWAVWEVRRQGEGGGHEGWGSTAGRCFDQAAFWIGFAVIDVVTEVCVVLAWVLLIRDVRTSRSRKASVICCFIPRIFVIIAIICRLVYLIPTLPTKDPAADTWAPVVITELQVCLSISTVCVPAVKPLFEAIETGVWQAAELRRRGLSLADLHSRGYLRGVRGSLGSVDTAALAAATGTGTGTTGTLGTGTGMSAATPLATGAGVGTGSRCADLGLYSSEIGGGRVETREMVSPV